MMNSNIVKIYVQRYVISGDVMNSVTAYDKNGRQVGREERTFRSLALTDDEVRLSVNANSDTQIDRESLGPPSTKW
jgi:hypothetical protein